MKCSKHEKHKISLLKSVPILLMESIRVATAKRPRKMPVSEDSRGQQNVDFKQKYRNLKRKLKLLIYENECYNEELRKAQRQLLQVTRDKNFLLDKLLAYENLDSTTSDSDATDSSDSENNTTQSKGENEGKKRKTSECNPSPSASPNLAPSSAAKKKKTSATPSVSRAKNINLQTVSAPLCKPSNRNMVITPPIKPPPTISQVVTNIPLSSTLNSEPINSQAAQSLLSVAKNDGQLTSEEIERHFESRQLQPSLLMPEKTPLTVPVELFSNESSTGLSEERN